MAQHAESIEIQRPRTEVFSYMSDVSREREWQPQLKEASQMPAGPTTVGSQRRYVSEFLGRAVTNTYTVVAFEPERRMVIESGPDSAVRATSEFLWEDTDRGTRVTMSVDGKPTGALRFIPKALLEATFRSEIRAALDRVKAILESA